MSQPRVDSKHRAVKSARRKTESARSSLSDAKKDVLKTEEAVRNARTESQRKMKESALGRARDRQRRKETELSSAEKGLSKAQSALEEARQTHGKEQQKTQDAAQKKLSDSQRRLDVERSALVRERLSSVPPATGAGPSSQRVDDSEEYDLFIAHASEDKEDFVRPFATKLQSAGLSVWYDEFTLTIGDNLRRSIDRGLAASRFGVVVLSPSFFVKEWPQVELDGLVQRQTTNGQKVILPIWHKVTRDEVLSYSPPLAGLIAITTATSTVDEIVEQIVGAVRRPPK
jgi:hypothetical protein